MFGKRAEGQLPSYLVKGTKVTVTGEFVMEEWQGQNGTTNKMPVIMVSDLDFASQNQQNSTHKANSGSNVTHKPQPQNDDFSDDLPF